MTPAKKTTDFQQFLPMLALIAVLFLGLLLRSAFLQGPVFDESLQAATSAWSLYTPAPAAADGGFVAAVTEYLRELAHLPGDTRFLAVVLGALYQLFGVSELVSLAPSLLAFVATFFLVYLLGRTWFNSATGILAAFLWSLLPVGVLLSTNLLPVMLVIAGDVLAIYFFAVAEQRSGRAYYLASFVILFIGLFADWTIFLPTAIFLLGWFVVKSPSQDREPIYRLLAVMAFAILLVPGVAAHSADLYYLLLLLFDNLLVLPLLALTLVAVAKAKLDAPLRFLLLWAGAKAAFIIVGSSWIAQNPLIETIGMSGFWLDLMVPCVLQIAWQFTRKLGQVQVSYATLLVSVLAIALFTLLTLGADSGWLPTISRVAVGLTFLLAFTTIAFWNAKNLKAFAWLFTALLLAFVFAAPSITDGYARSYSGPAEAVGQVSAYFATLPEDKVAFIGGEAQYQRFMYLNKFQPTYAGSDLTVYLLNQNQLGSVSAGEYAVVDFQLLKFALGSVPANWMEVFVTSGGQPVFVYQVAGEEEP